MIRALIVDDEQPARERLARLLGSFEDVETVGEAEDGEQAMTRIAELRPDVVFLDIQVAPSVPEVPYYGFDMRSAQYIYKADDPATAVVVGIGNSWRFIQEAYLTLKGILFGRVSSENVGGIITIGVVSHSWASVGITKLLFFLCMLSMNLAFLNVLPIPVLDGGHLFFLIIEKIKGAPLKEETIYRFQKVGLLLLLVLMFFAFKNDFTRLFS